MRGRERKGRKMKEGDEKKGEGDQEVVKEKCGRGRRRGEREKGKDG